MGNTIQHKKSHLKPSKTEPSLNDAPTSDTTRTKTLSAIYKEHNTSDMGTPKDLLFLLQKSKLVTQIQKEELSIPINVCNLIQEGKGLLSSKYQILTKLAHGATGTVFIAKNIITEQTVGIKLTEKNKNIANQQQIQNEIFLLKNLNHPHILRLFEFYESPTAFYMISELCKYGELYDRIKRGFTERELSIIIYQVFQALDYCHDNNVIHRDLKLENLLVNDIEKVYDDINHQEIESFWIKLIDFGTAKMFIRNRNEKTIIGTSYYIAPEVLTKNYNEKCDTWSVGVILYILLTGKAPFDGKNDHEIMHKIKNGLMDKKNEKLLNSSPECQNLIKSLLEVKIEKRLSAKDALNHIWFKKNKTLELLRNISEEKANKYIDNLLSYKVQSKLHQMIISFMTHNVIETDEQKDIIKMIRQFDSTHELRVSYSDFVKEILKYRAIEKEKIDEIFFSLDSNNDGYIEYEELLRGMISKDNFTNENNIRYAFHFFDTKNSNAISVKAIKRTFESIGIKISDKLSKKFFEEIKQKGKEISFEDFKQFVINSL